MRFCVCAVFCAQYESVKIHYIIFLRCFLRIRSSAGTSNMNPIGFIISYSSPLQHWSLTKHITIAQLFWPFILDLSYFFWTWNCPHIGLLYFIVLYEGSISFLQKKVPFYVILRYSKFIYFSTSCLFISTYKFVAVFVAVHVFSARYIERLI